MLHLLEGIVPIIPAVDNGPLDLGPVIRAEGSMGIAMSREIGEHDPGERPRQFVPHPAHPFGSHPQKDGIVNRSEVVQDGAGDILGLPGQGDKIHHRPVQQGIERDLPVCRHQEQVPPLPLHRISPCGEGMPQMVHASEAGDRCHDLDVPARFPGTPSIQLAPEPVHGLDPRVPVQPEQFVPGHSFRPPCFFIIACPRHPFPGQPVSTPAPGGW